MFLFQRIEELSVTGNSAISSIAEYILEDRTRILEKSLQEVAQETYTSKASGVRFAKMLGLYRVEGFPEGISQRIEL